MLAYLYQSSNDGIVACMIFTDKNKLLLLIFSTLNTLPIFLGLKLADSLA